MLLTLIHLTDIHLNNFNNPLLSKSHALWKALKAEVRHSSRVVCCVSGDIAQSGNEDEYFSYAIPLFDNIKNEIKKEVNLDCDFIFIPGNHDCDFSNKEINGTRELLMKNMGHTDLNAHTIETIKVQKNFEDFQELFHSSWKYCETMFKGPLLEKVKMNVGEKEIIFNLFNSSWISTLHENPGQMYFPVTTYKETMLDHIGDINITLVHHPDHWLEPNNRREFRELLEETSDIILTGHEHQSTLGVLTNWDSRRIQYIEGGVLQELADPNSSSFNIIHFNLNESKQNIIEYTWGTDHYSATKETGWQEIPAVGTVKNSQSNVLELDHEFSIYIKDLSIPLAHPRKTNLELNDLYIYPNVKEILFQKRQDELVEYHDLEGILSGITPQCHFVFSGDRESGKTSLGKVIFNYFYNQKEKFPLLIDGSNITPGRLNAINRIVEDGASKNYGADRTDYYVQLDKSERILIIDNWQNTSLNDKYKSKFLAEAAKWFDNIIFLAEKGSRIREIVLLISEDYKSDSYIIREFEIQELGFEKREELIGKWVTLGQEETLETEEFIRVKDRYEKAINSIIGQNYVPTFPLYILIILQTLESGTPHNFERSTNGYYYEVLIKQSLGKIQLSNEETDKMYNYLTELAYKFFTENISTLDENNWRLFHEYYRKEYALTPQQFSFDEFKMKFLKSKIFTSYNEGYKFSYPYLYYYFVAQFLAKDIQEEDCKTIVSRMCSNLYQSDNAHIIMFLTHLSKDRFIIKKVIESAKGIFDDTPLLKLEDDIGAINNLMDHIPRMVVGNIDVTTNRRLENQRKDEMNRALKEESNRNEDLSDEDVIGETGIEIANEINKAFKMIEIIGQILKNYYGSKKASEKMELCYEAFSVALRLNNMIIHTLKEDQDSLIRYITAIIKDNGLENDDEKIEKNAKRILYTMATAITYSTMERVSLFLGTSNLDEIFKHVVDEAIPYTSSRLINTAIKLEHYEKFPFEEVASFYKQLKDNKIAKDLLRNMVGKYLYMFETDYKERQQICTSVQIEYNPRVLIASTKGDKKFKKQIK
ncbi:metallophosphoesterase [Cytobacillus firmus]|uniref:Uncharacterized protein n=1 Tax=Cytobacillus firmus DS1 TaxID=1307436 RepID=W7L1A2_CYTFI|nr:metallophosphoesterase [Cytobacillus firmus]EWG09311.1 hypothetical protein PBF_20098 [Cytobacillus firmus DS1]